MKKNKSNCDIEDEKGNKLGKIKIGTFEWNKSLLFNYDESLLLTVTEKILSLKKAFDVKDSNGNTIGRLKKKKLFGGTSVSYEDSQGHELLLTEIPLSTASVEIYDNNGNVVAYIKKSTDGDFAGGFIEKVSPYELTISDLSYDRITLVGCFLAMFFAAVVYAKSS